MKIFTLTLCGIAAVSLAAVAGAQADTRRADPPSRASVVPAPIYQSAFQGYMPFSEPVLGDWRSLNDEVARIGGHVGIFRPSAKTEGPAPGRPSSPAHAPHH